MWKRPIKVFVIVCLLAISFSMVKAGTPSATLAETINNIVNDNSWTGSAETIHIGLIFGKAEPSAYDTLNVSQDYQWAWVRLLASMDGYTSQTLDNNVRDMMNHMFRYIAGIRISGYLPMTYTAMSIGGQRLWLDYDRYMITCYDLADNSSKLWDKSKAVRELQNCYNVTMTTTQPPPLGYSDIGWIVSDRYYDENAESLDIFLKMGESNTANGIWSRLNSLHWDGEMYMYRPGVESFECEVGNFAIIIGNYEETVGRIPDFDRISTDLYAKMLASGWNSIAWKYPSAMIHSQGKGSENRLPTNETGHGIEARLESTVAGIEALHMYYKISSWKANFVSLLIGDIPVWQEPVWKELLNSPFYENGQFRWRDSGETDNSATAAGALLLFLYGIIPDTGSLAIPCNEWTYQDFTSMIPATYFHFDYDARKIRIPVWAGNIKFAFGTETAQYTFPSDGIYDVQFGLDWNTVTGVVFIGNLSDQFHYLCGDSLLSRSDVNGDSKVDMTDVMPILETLGSTPERINWNTMLDIDKNKKTDLTDVTIALVNFGKLTN